MPSGNYILGVEIWVSTNVLELPQGTAADYARWDSALDKRENGSLAAVSGRLPGNPEDIPKVIEKLCVAREKIYIDVGLVRSLISFFEVPKGVTDICMVYDGTKSGLNKMMGVPWFPLPMINSLLRSVEPGTCWMGDNDVGQMFLNVIVWG
jgi:hypothetical protein